MAKYSAHHVNAECCERIDQSATFLSRKKNIKFIVSGFGPFQNVKENPTKIIADRLIEYLENREEVREDANDVILPLAALTTALVMETSAGAVREELDQLFSQHVDIVSDQTVVFLHLGVNVKANCFILEKCAYNDATFRVPDERGYQPRNQTVVNDFPYQQSLSSDLNISALKLQVNSSCPNLTLQVSTDPGRFVCNFTYFYSLAKARAQKSCTHSVFMHVPPFAAIGEEKQLHMVVTLMEAIYSQQNSLKTDE